jgi:hypothetical protein
MGILPKTLGAGQSSYNMPQNFWQFVWQNKPVPFTIQNLMDYVVQDSKKSRYGQTDLSVALLRSGLEFSGLPTTYRRGKEESDFGKLITGEVDIYQYLTSSEYKQPSRKMPRIQKMRKIGR